MKVVKYEMDDNSLYAFVWTAVLITIMVISVTWIVAAYTAPVVPELLCPAPAVTAQELTQ